MASKKLYLTGLILTFDYSSMVNVIFLLRWHYIAHMITSSDVDLDVLRLDNLRQMLQGVQHLVSQVAINHVEVGTRARTLLSPTVLRCRSHLLLNHLLLTLLKFLFKIEIVEY